MACSATALLAGDDGDYEDGAPRTFSCQTCHMRPTIGEGCDKNPPVRGDLPVHDLTGGNYWTPDAIAYLDGRGALRLGGGLTVDPYDEAVARNIRPVPGDQYGDPGPGGVYDHFDAVALNPPPGAVRATIELLYQPTSWEYIQFLDLANTGRNAFLAAEGSKLLDAWLNTGMAAPYAMASIAWQNSAAACSDGLDDDGDGLIDWDGGSGAAADPQCVGKPWGGTERRTGGNCGLGLEVGGLRPRARGRAARARAARAAPGHRARRGSSARWRDVNTSS